jgi:hypothetical protein
VKHQQLPPAVGLGRFNQLERYVREAVETVAAYQFADQLVVLPGSRVETIRTFRVVGVTVVGASDEGDPEP